MPEELTFNFLPSVQGSKYRWLNIDRCGVRVGKVRGSVEDNVLVIYSIIIFPEFEGNSYGRKTIDVFKQHFDIIIADRVRPSAVGFWEKMGFSDNCDGSFIFRGKDTVPDRKLLTFSTVF